MQTKFRKNAQNLLRFMSKRCAKIRQKNICAKITQFSIKLSFRGNPISKGLYSPTNYFPMSYFSATYAADCLVNLFQARQGCPRQ